MMPGLFSEILPGLYRGALDPVARSLGDLLYQFSAEVVIGHPTFRNERTIGPLLKSGIAGAVSNFPERKVAFVVVDGTLMSDRPDDSTLEAALKAAEEALLQLSQAEGENVLVIATPYEGYGGERTPGKGSALKLIFDEMEFCPTARLLILADGDLRNDMAQWQAVYRRVEQEHRAQYPEREFFVTAKYARHFVDASLTRFIVGPLTTLLGTCVPGGISGDIALSAGAVAKERGTWPEARRKYGTDIATTFDNLADPRTTLYEVYLGAKLHDITDEAKLSVMPAEVIGAALERILHYEERVRQVIEDQQPLRYPVMWGPDKTGIAFIDPGLTNVFNVDTKMRALSERWSAFEAPIEAVYGAEEKARLLAEVEELRRLQQAGEGRLRFLDIGTRRWASLLGRAVAYVLRTRDIETAQRALNYLYTAAFLEFCRERLKDLGLETISQVRAAQQRLGAPPEQAEAFYRERVDGAATALAEYFYASRRTLLE